MREERRIYTPFKDGTFVMRNGSSAVRLNLTFSQGIETSAVLLTLAPARSGPPCQQGIEYEYSIARVRATVARH